LWAFNFNLVQAAAFLVCEVLDVLDVREEDEVDVLQRVVDRLVRDAVAGSG
jgi:predicted RNA methylase